jgi:hypothetical protein
MIALQTAQPRLRQRVDQPYRLKAILMAGFFAGLLTAAAPRVEAKMCPTAVCVGPMFPPSVATATST